MRFIKDIFTYVPYAVFLLTCVTFVWRCFGSWRWRMVWMAWLLFCCSKFMCFRFFGGDVFYPDFPQPFIWFWNWTYSGAICLGVISIVTFFWKAKVKRWLLPTVAGAIAMIGLWNGVHAPEVHEVEVTHPALPQELEGYRIALVSDVHCSSAARRWRTEAIVKTTNALKPNLTCITGDLADGKAKELADDLAPLGELKAADGVYAVTGNHEYYFDIRGWKAFHRKIGLRFLMNECVFPKKGLALAGVPDIAACRYAGETMPDLKKAFAAATNGEFRVLLQHQPRFFMGNAAHHGVNLQLSGHTHGGIMPIIDRIVAKGNGGMLRGLYESDGGRLYVSPGSGQWAGFPMRFFDPSEITLITLRKNDSK